MQDYFLPAAGEDSLNLVALVRVRVARFGRPGVLAAEHYVLLRVTVQRVLMRLRLLKAADELRLRFGIALCRVGVLFALGLLADEHRLRFGIAVSRVYMALALSQPANRLRALAHGIASVGVLMRCRLRLLKRTDEHALLHIALISVRMLRDFRQRADERAAVVVAVSRVRMYHEVGIAAGQLTLRVIASRGVFVQIQAAVEHTGAVFQGNRRHDHKSHRHYQRQRREQDRGPVPALELPALPDIL